MKQSNQWANPNTASAENVSGMVHQLEDRARRPDQQMVNAALIQELRPAAGELLLDVGSGTGVLARLAAPKLGLDGKMVGIDISLAMSQAAWQFSQEAAFIDSTVFSVGQAEHLPYQEGIFDGAFAARLLLHVQDPQQVVREMARVVKPSGRVVVMDWDFETVVVDSADRELSRRVLHWRTDHLGGDNWIGRKLWRLMAQAGLTHLAIHPFVSIAQGEEDSLTQSLWRAAQGARENGIISPEEHEAWTRGLKRAIARGHFFASIVYFIVWGQKD